MTLAGRHQHACSRPSRRMHERVSPSSSTLDGPATSEMIVSRRSAPSRTRFRRCGGVTLELNAHLHRADRGCRRLPRRASAAANSSPLPPSDGHAVSRCHSTDVLHRASTGGLCSQIVSRARAPELLCSRPGRATGPAKAARGPARPTTAVRAIATLPIRRTRWSRRVQQSGAPG